MKLSKTYENAKNCLLFAMQVLREKANKKETLRLSDVMFLQELNADVEKSLDTISETTWACLGITNE